MDKKFALAAMKDTSECVNISRVEHLNLSPFLRAHLQWTIQDFPEEGVPTPRGGENIRFCQIFPKTA